MMAAVAAGVMANLAPDDRDNIEDFDQEIPAKLVLVGDEKGVVWYNEKDGDWWWFAIHGSPNMVSDVNYIWPYADGAQYSALITDGDGVLSWGYIDTNDFDVNDADPNSIIIGLPVLTPGSRIFVDANGYPLFEDNDNAYFDDVNDFAGFALGHIASGTRPNNYIQVYKLLNFDPDLLNTTIGIEAQDVATGPNNVRVGPGAGESLDDAKENTLIGKDAGTNLVDSNDNTGVGYNVIGGNSPRGNQDYPLLRTTTDQADLGLTQGTAVTTLTNLQDMRDDLTANYYLTNDIDASDTSTWNGGQGFEPIGKQIITIFTGTFDGNGYTISNLFINRTSNYNGLFGNIEGTAKIANVTMTDVDITGDDFTGGLVGYVAATATDEPVIQNCSASGAIKGHPTQSPIRVGGLVGGANGDTGNSKQVYIYDSDSSCTVDENSSLVSTHFGGFIGSAPYATIQNCYATGDVDGTDTTSVGGFIGELTQGSTINYCYATGDVIGQANTGGFAGGNGNVSGTGIIEKCYSTGNVTNTESGADKFGGFIGANAAGDIQNCYAWGDATSDQANAEVGGFCGDDTSGVTPFVNCYSIGTATGLSDPGGFIGDIGGGSVTDCYWDTEASGNATSDAGTGRDTDSMKTKSEYAVGWDFDTIWIMADSYDVHRVTALGAYAAGSVQGGADDGLYLGTYSGANNKTDPNVFFLDNLDRGTYQADKEHSMMYGYFADDPNDQWLTLNVGELNLPYARVDVNDVNVAGDITTTITDSQVVYSISGVLAGDSTFNFNDTTKILDVDGMTITGTTAIGLDMSGGTFATAVQNWPAAPAIQIAGTQAIKFDATNFNILLGTSVFASDEGQYNTGLGYQAGYYNDASGALGRYNIYIGYRAGYGDAGGAEVAHNVAIGYIALSELTTGGNNFGLGSEALRDTTTGSSNVAIGRLAMRNNLTGTSNIAVGAGAMTASKTGNTNVAIGGDTLRDGGASTAMDRNIAIGNQAEYYTSGDRNVSIGYGAGLGASGQNHSNNVNIGYLAGRIFSTGSSNVMIGYEVGNSVNGVISAATESNLLAIGNQDPATNLPLIEGYFAAHANGPHLIVNGELETTQGRIVNVDRYTANQTLDAQDHHVAFDTDGGAITATLPAGVAGTEYRIANTGTSANNLTITPDGAELLIGVNANFTLLDGESLLIVYEATEGWF